MKRIIALSMFGAALLLFTSEDLIARGGGGGGRGGGGGGARGGGGGGGFSAGRSPSMGGGGMSARPSGGYGGGGMSARPSGGYSGAARPGNVGGVGGAARPSTGAVGGAARPGVGAGGVGGPGTVGRPGVGAGGVAAGARPTAGQLNNFLDIPRASTGAVGAGVGIGAGAGVAAGIGAGVGGAAADFLQGGAVASQLPAGAGGGRFPGVGSPGVGGPGVAGPGGIGTGANLPGVGSGAAAQARQNFANNQPNRIENRQEYQGNRQQRRDEIRGQVAENHPRLDFWSNYPNWAAWRINRPYRWATWGALAGWCGYGATEATAYAYGDNVYYQGDQVYYGDQPVATADEYAQQAQAITASAPPTSPDQGEWMPLGVFALTQDGQPTGGNPTLYMQLAINKEGVINGTYQNMATGQVQQLAGMTDKKTQRVAWTVAGQQWPIMETGLSSFTQDTTPTLIHFADGQTQQWLLVRLEEPKQ